MKRRPYTNDATLPARFKKKNLGIGICCDWEEEGRKDPNLPIYVSTFPSACKQLFREAELAEVVMGLEPEALGYIQRW